MSIEDQFEKRMCALMATMNQTLAEAVALGREMEAHAARQGSEAAPVLRLVGGERPIRKTTRQHTRTVSRSTTSPQKGA
jgi:hypothetical protein